MALAEKAQRSPPPTEPVHRMEARWTVPVHGTRPSERCHREASARCPPGSGCGFSWVSHQGLHRGGRGRTTVALERVAVILSGPS
jgi:hypothetical protein